MYAARETARPDRHAGGERSRPRNPPRPAALHAGNRAFAHALAREARKSSAGTLEKHGRLDFESDLTHSMPVGLNEHRAHVIPYDELANSVIYAVNKAIEKKDRAWLNALANQIRAVFPNGPAQVRHGGKSKAALDLVAKKYYLQAEDAYNAIDHKLATSWSVTDALVDEVNRLIGALNNSPDNLRPGAGGTNSSIQQGLDPQPRQPNPVETLPHGTKIVTKLDEDNVTGTTTLSAPIDVLRVTALDEKMIWTQLTGTVTKASELHVFSSGPKLQSSDYAGMTSGTMTKTNPTHLAIAVPGMSHVFYLFKL